MPESFRNLVLPETLLSNLDSLGYAHMTPIQESALPGALLGQDVIGQAKTGSGKTAVFALTLLCKLDVSSLVVQALIICPTRELSLQVATEIRRLARSIQNVKVTALYGGQALSLQKQSLKHGTHIIVGTPGRIRDMLEKEALTLGRVQTLVLDEADRMLEMGFKPDIDFIIRKTPPSRQTLLFSATYPDDIQKLSAKYQKNPVRIQVDSRHKATEMDQRVYTCPSVRKMDAIQTLLLQFQPSSALIFCKLKQSTRDICAFLNSQGVSALALNGDLEQQVREEILVRFTHQSSAVLVATDVAARGLDIKELPVVINYDLPNDPEVYVHRMGRTGRAGHKGLVISLCAESEKDKLEAIARYQGIPLEGKAITSLRPQNTKLPVSPNVTFCIACGRKDKIRPGEILGTLTGEGGIEASDVGKIDVMDYASYVAIARRAALQADKKLNMSKIKGRSFRVRQL